jgi:ethanolamine ammonia-lyase large subunit
MLQARILVATIALTTLFAGMSCKTAPVGDSGLLAIIVEKGISIHGSMDGIDIPGYLQQQHIADVAKQHRLYQQVIGAAGPYKEGDQTIGVFAEDEETRTNARVLLANTTLDYIHKHPLLNDELQQEIWKIVDSEKMFVKDGKSARIQDWTLGQLKANLLALPEVDIKSIMPALDSDVIASVVKLMTNADLIQVGSKVFNPLAGSDIGAKGFLSARLQPNSPTDSPLDVQWQVFDLWSYGVGDLMLGNNPVSSIPESVEAVEDTLRDIIIAFKLEKVLPWVVLAHVDIQAELENTARGKGKTAMWFQSIAGTESANQVFGISTKKMINYAKMRTGPYGLYLESGQGADFTNGQAHGVDMATLESRKYGFAKVLNAMMPTQPDGSKPWMPVNDVAGFIGPEVFRTRDQLVRVALEDTVMGKLHGLTIGLDICSTFHMSVSPKDLEYAIDQIMPANPGYLMSMPTKQDPMLSYLSTGVHDHLRIRKNFGYKINRKMTDFFRDTLQIINKDGTPTEHFGDPVWVYLKYKRAKHDPRSEAEIRAEGDAQYKGVTDRGVILVAAKDGGADRTLIPQATEDRINRLYSSAKQSLSAVLKPEFIAQLAPSVAVGTESKNRDDYILHPSSGEVLSDDSAGVMSQYRSRISDVDFQIVITDGLNANALMDPGHLLPFLSGLRAAFQSQGFKVAKDNIVVSNGRVRAGYQIGQIIFTGDPSSTKPKTLMHIIGERPGTEHNNFSIYMTKATTADWTAGKIDHDITKVVSGISDTALLPAEAVKQIMGIYKSLN